MNKNYSYIMILICFLFINSNAVISEPAVNFLTSGIYKSINESDYKVFLSIREKGKIPEVSMIINELVEYRCTIQQAVTPKGFNIDLNLVKSMGDLPDNFKPAKGIIQLQSGEITLVLGEKKFSLKKVNLWDITYEGMVGPGKRFEMIFGSTEEKNREYFHIIPEKNDSITFYYFTKKKPVLVQYKADDWHLHLSEKSSNDEQNQAGQESLRLCFTLESNTAPAMDWEIDFRRSPVTDLGVLVSGNGKKKIRFWQSNDSNTLLYCYCNNKSDKKDCEKLYQINLMGKDKDVREYLNYQFGKNIVRIFNSEIGNDFFISKDKKTKYKIIQPDGSVIKQMSPVKKTFRLLEISGGGTCY